LKRLAFYYLKKGMGQHPSLLPSYDTVFVKLLYDWCVSTDAVPAQGGICVEFWKDGKRIRWVDFSVRIAGGGGDPIVREV
jgi:hypothetical protein